MPSFLKLALIAIVVGSSPLWAEHSNPDTEANTAGIVSERETVREKSYGLRFSCDDPKGSEILLYQLNKLVAGYGWTNGQQVILEQENPPYGPISLRLKTPQNDTSTLDLKERPELQITDEKTAYTKRDGTPGELSIASKKEILAALMQRGRLTELSGKFCNLKTLEQHIEVRQNIAAWSMKADWSFNSTPLYNSEVWNKLEDGSWLVKSPYKAHEAVHDTFMGTTRYEIGCLKGCKLIVSQGIMEHFKRNDEAILSKLNRKAGDSPFYNVESNFLTQQRDVPWNNWIAGDWGYIRNPDPESRKESGYEGCNVISIGNGLFGVYYDDDPDRTVDQALQRVYNWRARSVREEYTNELRDKLRRDPRDGGLLRDVRDVPQFYSAD